jgi:hypothetical protein
VGKERRSKCAREQEGCEGNDVWFEKKGKEEAKSRLGPQLFLKGCKDSQWSIGVLLFVSSTSSPSRVSQYGKLRSCGCAMRRHKDKGKASDTSDTEHLNIVVFFLSGSKIIHKQKQCGQTTGMMYFNAIKKHRGR